MVIYTDPRKLLQHLDPGYTVRGPTSMVDLPVAPAVDLTSIYR